MQATALQVLFLTTAKATTRWQKHTQVLRLRLLALVVDVESGVVLAYYSNKLENLLFLFLNYCFARSLTS